MNNNTKIAQNTFLTSNDLNEIQMNEIINYGLSYGLDFTELFFQKTKSENWILRDGAVKSGNYSLEYGAGYRGLSDEKTGFAYTEDVNYVNLLECAKAVKCIASRPIVKIGTDKTLPQEKYNLIYPSIDLVQDVDVNAKINILNKVNDICRGYDPKVKRVEASLSVSYEEILVINSENVCIGDVRPLLRLSVSVITEFKGKRESGYAGGGGRYTFAEFEKLDLINVLSLSAVKQAIIKLEAVDAPAGEMMVVLGSGWPGVLLHEAIGHGLEGDFNRKELSSFTGKIGKKVASDQVTVVDSGIIDGRRGSINIDDEGTPSQENILIEKGILKKYMMDKLNARLMGVSSTGNGRRESYAHVPIPRMTNTYMMPGKYLPEEIISSVKKGIYAVNFDGGQVDITSGKFVFSANEAYMIENGKIKAPLKDVSLIGDGHVVLSRIDMVGDDLELDLGIGVCGKDGQSVPVGVGIPTTRIAKVTVGGK